MPAEQPFLEVKWQENRNITSSVQSVEIEDNDQLADKATVVLSDPETVGISLSQSGQTITIELGWRSEHAILFDGIVMPVRGSESARSSRQLTLVAYDKSYLMNIQAKTRDHTGLLSAILQNIVGAYRDISIGRIQPSPDTEFPASGPPLRQVNRTDLQFIQDIASHYGARAFVEYNDGRSKFYFMSESSLLQGDPLGHLRCCGGINQIIEFNYERVSSGASPRQGAATHNPATGETVTSERPPTVPQAPASTSALSSDLQRTGTGASAVLTSGTQAAATGLTSDTLVRESSVAGLPSNPALPQTATDRQDRTRVLGLLGHGLMVGSANMRAKGKVEIQGIAPWAAGDWYVRLVKHLYRAGDRPRNATYQTQFEVTR
jgi:phage protein D